MWIAESGGNRKLNTITAITPLAFASCKGHKSVCDMTRSGFIKNTISHLEGCFVLTEFSSWSHSPYFAFYYAHRRKSFGTVHVAIVDTEELAKSNPAFHVPALGKIFGSSGGYNYEEEYLIHGVIEGQFYKAVPYDKLCELGLLKHLPALCTNTLSPFDIHGIRAIPGEEVDYTIDELRQLRTIALSYGGTFSLPMAIVLFCCKKRPGYWSQLSTSDLETIIKVLGGWKEIPRTGAALAVYSARLSTHRIEMRTDRFRTLCMRCILIAMVEVLEVMKPSTLPRTCMQRLKRMTKPRMLRLRRTISLEQWPQ